LNPSGANPLEQGEWLQPNAAGTYERHAAAGHGPLTAYPVASAKGSTDGQVIGCAELFISWEEAYTTTYNPAGANYNVGTPLMVNQVAIGGLNKSVLTTAGAADNVVAVVIEEPADKATNTVMKIRRANYLHA
jgi:hypothetical protein